jgi:hypothetical protein
MSETKDNTSVKSTQEHPVDVSYKDETGTAEILQTESSHVFTTDGSVDMNVCGVSDNGGHSWPWKAKQLNIELIVDQNFS